MNILVPASGENGLFAESLYPKLLFEINGKTMIQQCIDEYEKIENKHFVFTFLEDSCRQYHFDSIVNLTTNHNCDVVKISGTTGGALCSCLMAIEYINSDEELLISNYDQVIDVDYNLILNYFRENDMDAGVISFENVHPRWSYIRVDDGFVVESAAKTPISKLAIAGFYYFKKGSDFIEAAKRTILKGKTNDLPFYVSDSLNDLVLRNKRIGYYNIDVKKYHTFRTYDDVKKYEGKV